MERQQKRSRENRAALLAVAAAMEGVHLNQFRFAKLAAAKQAAVRLLPTRFLLFEMRKSAQLLRKDIKTRD